MTSTHRPDVPWYALTVHQPWAHAILHLGKDVENRSWSTLHRGPLAIHASRTVLDEVLADAHRHGVRLPAELATGAVLGVVNLVRVHRADDCPDGPHGCSQWAEPAGWHWRITDPRPLPRPLPCAGARRLWRLPEPIHRELQTALAAPAAPGTVGRSGR